MTANSTTATTSAEALAEAGAFALYKAENGHRILELQQRADGEKAIRADFENYRSRYTRKFADLAASFAEAGLTINQSASRAA